MFRWNHVFGTFALCGHVFGIPVSSAGLFLDSFVFRGHIHIHKPAFLFYREASYFSSLGPLNWTGGCLVQRVQRHEGRLLSTKGTPWDGTRSSHSSLQGDHWFHRFVGRFAIPKWYKASNENSIESHHSDQIIATSHDLTPNGRVVGEPCLKWPYFREIQVGEIL